MLTELGAKQALGTNPTTLCKPWLPMFVDKLFEKGSKYETSWFVSTQHCEKAFQTKQRYRVISKLQLQKLYFYESIHGNEIILFK